MQVPVVDQLQRRAVTSVFRAVAMPLVAVVVLGFSAAGRAAFKSSRTAGQGGHADVVYVPTPRRRRQDVGMARVKEDVVYDLGCGDGRIVGGRQGAKAIG